MENEVVAGCGFVDELFYDREGPEAHGKESAEDVVVIPAQVNYVELVFFNSFEDEADELRVDGFPVTASVELPAVYDVAVKDEALTTGIRQKVDDLLSLAIFGSQVQV